MALQLSISAVKSSDCTKFTFSETTGAYDVTDNPTGWGVPNEDIANVASAEVIVKDYSNSITYDTIDVSASFPDSAGTATYDINWVDLDLSGTDVTGTSFPDSIYCITYRVTMNGGQIYEATVYKLVLCVLECQVYSTINTLVDNDCANCSTKVNIEKFLTSMTLLRAIHANAQCPSSLTDLQVMITTLENYFKNFKCKNC